MGEATLTKLTIRAFKDPKLEEEITGEDIVNPYTISVNPEKYSLLYKTQYTNVQPTGTSKGDPKFIRSLPEDLDLEFLFDRTGIFQNNVSAGKDSGSGVTEDIDQFKKVVFDYNGNQHKPNYLKIVWGTLNFPCIMTEMSIEYKLFRPDGLPLRAVAKVKFKNFVEEAKRVAEEKNSSPDLTHYRLVLAGDTLPLMTKRIYGDSKYYLEVAKANKLTSFRKLVPGQQIFFPPIQKQQ